MGELSDLPNVGKVLAAHFLCIGIKTPEAITRYCVKEAFVRIRAHDSGACLHMLYGI